MLLYITLFPSLCVLSKVNGISVKIDGLVDLGPKWNFEYTFIPYDSNTNIVRKGPDIKTESVADATSTTPAKKVQTERVATKKKHRHKKKTEEEAKQPPVSSEKPLEKPTEAKSETHSEHSEKHPEKSKHLRHSKKHSKKSEKRPGKSENNQKESGRTHRKRKKSREGEKVSAKNATQKIRATTPDFIYKDADNKSLILRSPHKVQEDTRLRDFTVHIYKQALKIFEELKKKVNDTKSTKQIDKLIHSYRDKFAEFVNETQYVMVKTRLGTQKVILNTMESSNNIMRKLSEHLMADNEHKASSRSKVKGVADLFEATFDKEMDVEYQHVCSKFGVCRSGYVFSNFLADVFGELLRADDKKLQIALDSLTEVAKEWDIKQILHHNVEKRFMDDIAYIEKMDPDQIRVVLQIIRGMLVNKYKPLPIMGGIDSKVMNRSLTALDLIDLFDDNIKPNEENKLAWNDLKAKYREWIDGSRHDISKITYAFAQHIAKTGIEKLDTKTKKLLNDKLKFYYDIKR